jgi:saccharopine dehydrogenase-like NADP-dependent oxidoreductase
MKVIQLGCGITGVVCAEELAKNKKITELVLADLYTSAAEALAKRLKSSKISVEKVDATDEKALKKLMKGADIIVSSVSWTLNEEVMRVAMEMGVDYVDFSMTIDYEKAFKQKNITTGAKNTILSCMGSDPGISDVFARHAVDKLDRVDELRTMDGDTGAAEGMDFYTLWSPNDMMEEASTPAGIFKDGKMTFAAPLTSKSTYEFPAPIGKLTVYNTDHEETFIMSNIFKGVKNVDFRIAIDDGFVNVVKALMLVGLNRCDPVDVKGVKVAPIDLLTALMPKPTDFADRVKGAAAIVVEATGVLKGKKTMIKMWTIMSHEKAYKISKANATGYLVGIAGAIGTEMLIDGEIKQKGLVWPEMISSESFIRRMKSKGMEVHEQVIAL